MAAKVWVPQRDDNRDFSSAKKFGELHFILGNRTDVYPDTELQEVVDRREMVHHKLFGGSLFMRGSKSGAPYFEVGDYLMLSGDPAVIAMCVESIAARGFRNIRLLKYDRDNKGYYHVGG